MQPVAPKASPIRRIVPTFPGSCSRAKTITRPGEVLRTSCRENIRGRTVALFVLGILAVYGLEAHARRDEKPAPATLGDHDAYLADARSLSESNYFPIKSIKFPDVCYKNKLFLWPKNTILYLLRYC